MEKVNAVRVTVKKKMALRAAETISDINSMSKILIGEYRHLKKSYKGVKNVEVHHIIEKRLLRKRWKKQIGYGTNYSSVIKIIVYV